MSVAIDLTASEILMGAHAGCMRQLEAIREGLKSTNNKDEERDDDNWQIHIEGALAEQAVAKYLNVYWDGKGTRGGADLCGYIDVKHSPNPTHRLIVKQNGHKDWLYWFVTGGYGMYQIHGWCWGVDAKRDDYWEDPTGGGRWAYFVPRHALHGPEDRSYEEERANRVAGAAV